MAFKATPIHVCANHPNNSYSQLGFKDSWLDINHKNSCSELHFSLRPRFPKWECLAVVSQRAIIHTEDDKPLSPIDEVDQTLISPLKTFHRDMNYLPKPLTAKDFDSSPTDGSKVRVAHQGSRGAYSEAAALKAYPNCVTVPCDHFESVFKAVDLWMVEKAVLPIENSVGGSIHRNYDLLLRHRLHIVGEVKLVVNHCLLALPGVKKEELKKVLSHPQALDQCTIVLDDLGVDRLSAGDTGSAAQIVASGGVRDMGAVASPRAAEVYGLTILAERIQDDLDNVTRFLVLAREPIIPGTDRPYKTSIVFTLEEGPGVLFKALAVFAMRDILLTKIESRPESQRPIRIVDEVNKETAKYFDYLFFVDLEASTAEPRAQNALKNLQEYARFIRVLGCYPINKS